jgi:hypothetical protein
MRLPIRARPAALLAAAALTVTGVVAAGVATATPASACDSYYAALMAARSHTPISADAPFDTIAWNGPMARYPAVYPRWGTDFGHLPRWKSYPGGRVLLREDRVTLRSVPTFSRFVYTNVNPRIRSYWLDRDVVISVAADNYHRMTGGWPDGTPRLYRVSRQQFLDSFNTRGDDYFRWVRYRTIYRLTFDRSHTHIRQITEIPIFLPC